MPRKIDFELTDQQRRSVLNTMTSAMGRAAEATCSGCIAAELCLQGGDDRDCWVNLVAAVESHFAHCWGDGPKQVILKRTISGDGPFCTIQASPAVYDAQVNPYGAVSVVTPDGRTLGLRLGEFEWVESEAA